MLLPCIIILSRPVPIFVRFVLFISYHSIHRILKLFYVHVVHYAYIPKCVCVCNVRTYVYINFIHCC